MTDDAPQWDLTPLFESRAEWQAEIEEVRMMLDDVTDADGVVTSYDTIESLLESVESVVTRTERVLAYARLRFDLDRFSEQRTQDLKTARELYGDVATATRLLPSVLASRPDELRSDRRTSPWSNNYSKPDG